MSALAKALYDNTAECADELAFRKGDIVIVMDQKVAGTSGWWMCSLYGRHGLAPANRLKILPQTFACTAADPTTQPETCDHEQQNIYQIPSVPRPHLCPTHETSPAYERMDMIYKVPSRPLSASRGLKNSPQGPEENKVLSFSLRGDVYDVPSQTRRASLFTVSTPPQQPTRKHSLVPMSELEKRFDCEESLRCSSPRDAYVYAVPPGLAQDPNYDIPVPSSTEAQNNMISGFRTLPSPRKHEWIYDVPVSPDKQSPPQGFQERIPSKTVCRKLYNTLPTEPVRNSCPSPSLYDIPKSSSLDTPSPPKLLPRIPIYDKLPIQEVTEELVYDFPRHEDSLTRDVSDTPSDHIPLECRVDSSTTYEHTSTRLYRIRNFLAYTSLRIRPGSQESLTHEDNDRSRTLRLSAVESQRISTASSSSTSSCDSLPLSSSSPEPLREVTLRQNEACRRLLDLQEAICKAVPRLMEFVSSHWRSKKHLEKYLEEIKQAAGEIACSLTSFLNFVLDIKGNARHLTDTNLQTRIYKQLSIVEDSGVILQQTVSALNVAGWPLNTLCQDSGQVQTPDQLERFVMVVRTVPEDVKRLVSIINANGKLLFRAPQKDPKPSNTMNQPEIQQSPERREHEGDEDEDDNDYVELQTKTDFEIQQEEVQKEPKESGAPASNGTQAESKCHSVESSSGTDDTRPWSLSEHCRLYFGALQKAIAGFVSGLQDGAPPEKFISQSKLVIMVGQRLVDTLCREAQRPGSAHSLCREAQRPGSAHSLCREAQRPGSAHSLLCKSNHLCALLKQLAVATKKAALHFPDKQALLEAQEFAKELAQRAQHFRLSLDL